MLLMERLRVVSVISTEHGRTDFCEDFNALFVRGLVVIVKEKVTGLEILKVPFAVLYVLLQLFSGRLRHFTF